MTDLVLLPLAFFAITALVGVATIAPLRNGYRQALLPAAPVVGAALIAVVLSGTSWVLAAGWGMLAVAAVAAASLVIAVRQGGRPWSFRPSNVAVAIMCWVIGGIGAALALSPNIQIGDSGIVLGNSNHDALYYASVAGWLAEHPMFPFPVVGTSPDQGLAVPAFGAAAFSISFPLRVGQSMVHAGLTRAVGSEVMVTTMPILGLWLAIIPGAVFVTLRLLRTRVPVALGGSVAVTFSSLLVYQVTNQNLDSLFGVSLAVLTIGAVVAASRGRLSRWPAAVLLSALVAAYTEYALFVAPAVLGGVLLHRSRRFGRNLIRALQVAALAVLIAPTAWYRGAKQLITVGSGGGGDAWPSPFITEGSWAGLNRLLGSSIIAPDSPDSTLAASAAVFAIAIVLGWVSAVLLSRGRGVWIGLLAVGVSYIAYLTLTARGYTQFRAVLLFLPLAVLAATAGWGAWLDQVARWQKVSVRWVTGSVLVLVLASWTVVNVRTVRAQVDPAFAAGRHVGIEYQEAVQWVSEFGGSEGEDVTVLAPDFVENIALNLSLRNFDRVSYPMENENYLYVGEFWDRRDDPYLLIGTGTQTDVVPSAIVRRNDKFMLVDRRVMGGTVVAPMDLTGWYWFAQPDGSFLGKYGSKLLVIRSEHPTGNPTVELRSSDGGPMDVELADEDGGHVIEADIDQNPKKVDLPDEQGSNYVVTLERPDDVDQSAEAQISLPRLVPID